MAERKVHGWRAKLTVQEEKQARLRIGNELYRGLRDAGIVGEDQRVVAVIHAVVKNAERDGKPCGCD